MYLPRKCAIGTFNILFENTQNKHNMVLKLLAHDKGGGGGGGGGGGVY